MKMAGTIRRDFSEHSVKALKWTVDNVVKEGDHLLLVTVRPHGNYEHGEILLWEATGSRARRLGVAVDFSRCSIKALKWTADNVVKEGDHLILVIVRHTKSYERGEMQLWETTGSPLIPLAEFSDPVLMKRYELKPPPEVIDIALTAAREKNIVALMKIYWGDARERLMEAIDQVPLDHLIVGNRGLGSFQRAIMGSVSNFVVNHASCSVTVVKTDHHHH